MAEVQIFDLTETVKGDIRRSLDKCLPDISEEKREEIVGQAIELKKALSDISGVEGFHRELTLIKTILGTMETVTAKPKALVKRCSGNCKK